MYVLLEKTQSKNTVKVTSFSANTTYRRGKAGGWKSKRHTVSNKKTHLAVFETCVFRVHLRNHKSYLHLSAIFMISRNEMKPQIEFIYNKIFLKKLLHPKIAILKFRDCDHLAIFFFKWRSAITLRSQKKIADRAFVDRSCLAC